MSGLENRIYGRTVHCGGPSLGTVRKRGWLWIAYEIVKQKSHGKVRSWEERYSGHPVLQLPPPAPTWWFKLRCPLYSGITPLSQSRQWTQQCKLDHTPQMGPRLAPDPNTNSQLFLELLYMEQKDVLRLSISEPLFITISFLIGCLSGLWSSRNARSFIYKIHNLVWRK